MTTQRETIARYLELTGCTLIKKTDKGWDYVDTSGLFHFYLGASGSFRIGRNFTTSRPVDSKLRTRALTYFATAVDSTAVV